MDEQINQASGSDSKDSAYSNFLANFISTSKKNMADYGSNAPIDPTSHSTRISKDLFGSRNQLFDFITETEALYAKFIERYNAATTIDQKSEIIKEYSSLVFNIYASKVEELYDKKLISPRTALTWLQTMRMQARSGSENLNAIDRMISFVWSQYMKAIGQGVDTTIGKTSIPPRYPVDSPLSEYSKMLVKKGK